MIKTNNSKNGFSLIEVLIVLVALALIMGAGYTVYKHGHKSSSDVHVNQTDWQTYKTSFGVSFKYPQNWSVENALKGNLVVVKPDPGKATSDNLSIVIEAAPSTTNSINPSTSANFDYHVPNNGYKVLKTNFNADGNSNYCLVGFYENGSSSPNNIDLQPCKQVAGKTEVIQLIPVGNKS